MSDPIFDSPAPIRPQGKPRVTVPVGGATVRTQCPACDRVTDISADWRGSLCGECRARLEALIAQLQTVIATLDAEGEEVTADFEQTIKGLPIGLGDRFAVLQQTHDRALEAYEHAQTHAKAYQTDAQILAQLQSAREHFQGVQDKIARSAKNPDNDLAPVIRSWQSFIRESKRLGDIIHRRRVALQMAIDLYTNVDIPF